MILIEICGQKAVDINMRILYIILRREKTPRGVAQFGSASGLGPEGRRFKSYHPDQSAKPVK